MTAHPMRHISLPIFNDDTGIWGPARETLEVEELGAEHLRLLHSPALVDGLAQGDIIVLGSETAIGYKLVERSGNLAVVVAFERVEQRNDLLGSGLREVVEGFGGWYEGGPEGKAGGLAVFTLPLSVGFKPIEDAFNRRTSAVPGTSWWFGNVYEPGTKRLLGWWNQKK